MSLLEEAKAIAVHAQSDAYAINCGITYGHVRAVVGRLAELEEEKAVASIDARRCGCVPPDVPMEKWAGVEWPVICKYHRSLLDGYEQRGFALDVAVAAEVAAEVTVK